MADYPINLALPEAIFEPIKHIAEAKDQPIEQVVLDQLRSVMSVSLPALPTDEESELVVFKFLSDDTLRNIAREQMPQRIQERMQVLMDRNNLGTITAQEFDELSELVDRSQRLTLRKAWAAGVLMERGHSIAGEDFAPEDV